MTFRVQNGTKLYDGMAESEVARLGAYLLAFRIGAPLMMLVVLGMLVCSSVSYAQRPAKARVVLRWIVGASFFAALTQVIMYLQANYAWEGRDAVCAVTPGIATAAYVLSNSCGYMFLQERARTTASFMEEQPRAKLLLKVLLVVTYLSPLFCLSAFFLVQGNVVWAPQLPGSPHLCAFHLEAWIAVLFMISDAFLGVGYLLVFIIPVYRIFKTTARLMSGKRSYAAMRKLVLTNLVASVVAITSTFSVMVCISYGMASLAYDDAPKLLYWTWTYPLVTLDSAVKIVSFAYVTHIWIPPALAGLLFRGNASLGDSSERGTGANTTGLHENNHLQQQQQQQQQHGSGSGESHKGWSRQRAGVSSVQGQAPESRAQLSVVPGTSSYRSMTEEVDSEIQDGYV
jgi:hypothetical protein